MTRIVIISLLMHNTLRGNPGSRREYKGDGEEKLHTPDEESKFHCQDDEEKRKEREKKNGDTRRIG